MLLCVCERIEFIVLSPPLSVCLSVYFVVLPHTLLYWTSKNIRYIPVHMPTP